MRYRFAMNPVVPVADPDQAFGGVSQIGGRQNIFTC